MKNNNINEMVWEQNGKKFVVGFKTAEINEDNIYDLFYTFVNDVEMTVYDSKGNIINYRYDLITNIDVRHNVIHFDGLHILVNSKIAKELEQKINIAKNLSMMIDISMEREELINEYSERDYGNYMSVDYPETQQATSARISEIDKMLNDFFASA